MEFKLGYSVFTAGFHEKIGKYKLKFLFCLFCKQPRRRAGPMSVQGAGLSMWSMLTKQDKIYNF